jgi:menaquinone-dependent protoporphyrinogen oxidase
MDKPKGPISRRKFLRNSVLIAGAGVLVLGGAGVALASQTAPIEFIQTHVGKETAMSKKVLIAYASKCGSTGEVAQAIAEELNQAGFSVDVSLVQTVKNLDGYQAVVLGGAARMGKLLPAAAQFAEKYRADLGRMPAAYFTTGVTMITDTTENRLQAAGYLEPLCQVRQPVATGLFAGKVDHTKMEFPFNFLMSFVKEGQMVDGDYRDWTAIRAWARELAPKLAVNPG